MKVKVIKLFRDKNTNLFQKIGQEIEITEGKSKKETKKSTKKK